MMDHEINTGRNARIEYKKQEISVLLNEYNALRDEIVSISEASRNILGITIALIGAFLGILPLILENVDNHANTKYIFLVFPLFLFGLAWSQLKYLSSMLDIGEYLKKNNIKNIRKSLTALHFITIGNPGDKIDKLMTWEEKDLSRVKRFDVWWLPIIGSHYGIPIGASLLSFVIYFLVVPVSEWIDILSLLLIIINIFGFVYSFVFGFLIEMKR